MSGLNANCEEFRRLRVSRRGCLYAGTLGAVGLSLADLYRSRAAVAAPKASANSVIFLFIAGGVSHIDTLDPKPEAPAEVRSIFAPLETNVTGIRFTDQMPRLAKQTHRLAVIRSMRHPDFQHETAWETTCSGWGRNPALTYPNLGSVVANVLGERNNLPGTISVPGNTYMASHSNCFSNGYLSPRFRPFAVSSEPSSSSFSVRDISLVPGIDSRRLTRRRGLLEQVDACERRLERSGLLEQADQFEQAAFSTLLAPEAKRAFAIDKEPQKVRDAYGMTRLGQRFLLARRLVEAGVPFVTVDRGVNGPQNVGDLGLRHDRLRRHSLARRGDHVAHQRQAGLGYRRQGASFEATGGRTRQCPCVPNGAITSGTVPCPHRDHIQWAGGNHRQMSNTQYLISRQGARTALLCAAASALMTPAPASANGAMGLALATFPPPWWALYVLVTLMVEAALIGVLLRVPWRLALSGSLAANAVTGLTGCLCSGIPSYAFEGVFGTLTNPNPFGRIVLLFSLSALISGFVESVVWRSWLRNEPLQPTTRRMRSVVLGVHLATVPVGLGVLLIPSRPYPGLEGQTDYQRRIAFERPIRDALELYLQDHETLPEADSAEAFLQQLIRSSPLESRKDAWLMAYEADQARFDTHEMRRKPLELNPAAHSYHREKTTKPVWILRRRPHDGWTRGLVIEPYGTVKWTSDPALLGSIRQTSPAER